MNAFVAFSAVSRTPPALLIPGASIFPPLPAIDQPKRPTTRRLPLYCPDQGPGGRLLGASSGGGDVSVGHGPGTPRNEGTADDRGTPVPGSNLTEIEPTQEPAGHKAKQPSGKDADKPTSGSKGGSAAH